jgi:lipopolysaccharide/colanic/teichoic acid biosynthesis glycosyltransferase
MWKRGGKRLFDLVVAASLLLLAAPLTLLVALVVLVTLGRPVCFRQRRPGLHGVLFTILKFRTMREGLDQAGRPLPDERRLTRIGAVLRRASLDELPTLWNVVRGDMSLVGPRPLLPEYLDRYSPQQARRHEVRPGITGLAQVSGRNALNWDDRLALDVKYVENLSFRLDMTILLKTVLVVLSFGGISQPGHATVEEFMGSQEESRTAARDDK